MKASADVQQRSNPPTRLHPAASWSGDSRQQPECGGLAGAIATDQSQRFASTQRDCQIAQGPQVPAAVALAEQIQQHAADAAPLPEQVPLTDRVQIDQDLR